MNTPELLTDAIYGKENDQTRQTVSSMRERLSGALMFKPSCNGADNHEHVATFEDGEVEYSVRSWYSPRRYLAIVGLESDEISTTMIFPIFQGSATIVDLPVSRVKSMKYPYGRVPSKDDVRKFGQIVDLSIRAMKDQVQAKESRWI